MRRLGLTMIAMESGSPTEPPPEIRFKRRLVFSAAMSELWTARELIRTLVERDLKVRYKRTVLGFGWAILSPVVFMLVFTVFFQRAGHFATQGVPYALFSYTALVPWTFFSEAVTLGSASIISNVPLLNKVYCPREVFPLATMFTAAFDTAVSTAVLIVLFVIYQYPPAVTTFWVPLLILIEVLFALGFSLVTSSVLIYLRDLRYVVPMIVQIGMFASPVAYGLDVIPSSFRPVYSVLDPLGPILDGFRRTVLHGQAPSWNLLRLATIASVVWLVGGYITFKRLETRFADIA